jgi:NAD(P)H-hydrate epimerase
VEAVLTSFSGPIVMDADALTHFSSNLAALKGMPGSLLLTPHSGEMARLLGISTHEVESDRLGAVTEASRLSGATVLLKGASTLISSPQRLPVIHLARAPALATAGSGDVLAGILAPLCTAMPPDSAAAAGVFVHARAAEAWQAANQGADRGLLAHEVIDWVPRIIAGLTQGASPLPT